ncbi:2-amino-4-hydroxy-6-hydroxymethyldihydropteridinepyrophosphokinase [hydrothermal vent metagenome]|uniref:2-amino-4-hydroxy-6-hydroxymethyldihydropteridine diphosphokinase n=1 Tax=hydrothermal vent metagenome TaxID=652676 RepID=A0A3B1BHD4_9ZZZZ
MSRVYISIGSNIEAEKHIRLAVAELRQHYGDVMLSSVYESEPVGFAGDNFLNMVAGLDTDENVQTVSAVLHDIEDRHGRLRDGPRFSARTLDLDLLLYDDLIINNGSLQIPRDEITKNAFVLWPLAELDPICHHPLSGQTMAELWENYDKSSQALWPVELLFPR